MSNVHAALPTEVKGVKTLMYLRLIRGRIRWPRGQRVANGAFVGNLLALRPTGSLLLLVHRGFTGLKERQVAVLNVLRLPNLFMFLFRQPPRNGIWYLSELDGRKPSRPQSPER